MHIISDLSINGAQKALYNLLIGGLADNFNNIIVCLLNKGLYGFLIQNLNIPVEEIRIKKSMLKLQNLIQFQSIIKKYQPDLIQGWMYHGNLAANIAGYIIRKSKPIVVWNVRHSLYSLTNEKFLTKLIIKISKWFSYKVDTIIYNSQVSRRQHESFGFSKKFSLIIPNGFDTNIFRPDLNQKKIMRKQLGIPEKALVVGHVARFHPMKDHFNFLKAAVKVIQNFNRNKVYFLLIGRGVTIQNPVFSKNIPNELINRFYLMGERDDIPKLMQTMDIFCLSSKWGEGFPNVVGEAMASGIPCVVTDVGDCAYIVGDTGIIVPPSNSEALAQGLLKMLNKSEEERKALGKAARIRIKNYFSLEKVVKTYEKLYINLISKKYRFCL